MLWSSCRNHHSSGKIIGQQERYCHDFKIHNKSCSQFASDHEGHTADVRESSQTERQQKKKKRKHFSLDAKHSMYSGKLTLNTLSDGCSIILWGGFSSAETAKLVRVNRKVNAVKSRATLTENELEAEKTWDWGGGSPYSNTTSTPQKSVWS